MKQKLSLRVLAGSILLSILLLSSIPALATTTFQPVYKPTLEVKKTDSPIKIDGHLNDAVWKSASKAANFVERSPGDMVKPEVETEAFITYDDENLYIAFACYDDPSTIRATMCQRDQFHSDDAVCLKLDTYGEATWAYEFYVNPYGVQKDNLWTSVQGSDSGFDLVWRSAAQITENGYQVEMAIPFSSMRFPNKDVQSWKMDFWRNRPRESFNQYSWAAFDRNEQCWPCQWGTVSGFSNVAPGKGLEILPTIVGNQAGALSNMGNPTSNFDSEKADGELSLGGKYSVSSDVTIEAYYNPDFSQIEADAAQIDVNTTFALYYPERRPFFQEGSDLFRTIFNSFYTRTVNDPEYTLKVTGRREGLSVGFMSAMDKTTPYIVPHYEGSFDPPSGTGESYVNVLRALKSFGNNSNLGFIITDRRFDNNGSGTVIGLDGNIRLSRNYSIVGQVLKTYSKEPNDSTSTQEMESAYGIDAYNTLFGDDGYNVALDGESFSGEAFITQFRRRARNWNFTVDFNQVSPTYRTETGFDPWVNYRNFSIYSQYNFYLEKGLFERITPQFYTGARWDFDGSKRWRNLNFALEGNLRLAQTYFNISYGSNSETWSGINYNDLWHADLNLHTRFGGKIELGLSIGRNLEAIQYAQARGKATSIDVSLDLKPFDRLVIEPNINYATSNDNITDDRIYRQFISRTRFRFQASKALSIRLVVQYNDRKIDYFDYESKRWDIDPLLTYQISPFSKFYIGSTMDYRHFNEDTSDPSLYKEQWKMSSRQFFMKLQYLFQT
ncbi:MAG: carbohydrate binding family 9 domain-containing protein [candidate division Zixibacteria bacterium]|nr:carbohydrate binding family 9 domain-containing protein [candidate division Zixibacteria bacterium]